MKPSPPCWWPHSNCSFQAGGTADLSQVLKGRRKGSPIGSKSMSIRHICPCPSRGLPRIVQHGALYRPYAPSVGRAPILVAGGPEMLQSNCLFPKRPSPCNADLSLRSVARCVLCWLASDMRCHASCIFLPSHLSLALAGHEKAWPHHARASPRRTDSISRGHWAPYTAHGLPRAKLGAPPNSTAVEPFLHCLGWVPAPTSDCETRLDV